MVFEHFDVVVGLTESPSPTSVDVAPTSLWPTTDGTGYVVSGAMMYRITVSPVLDFDPPAGFCDKIVLGVAPAGAVVV